MNRVPNTDFSAQKWFRIDFQEIKITPESVRSDFHILFLLQGLKSIDFQWTNEHPGKRVKKYAWAVPGIYEVANWVDWVTASMAVQSTGLFEWQPGWLSSLMVWLNDSRDGCPVYWFVWMTARMAVQFTGLIDWLPGRLVLGMGELFGVRKWKYKLPRVLLQGTFSKTYLHQKINASSW